MYPLYLDRATEFACDISVKNASLKDAMARMIVKSDNLTLLFEGKIKDGKCIIPIGRLKGLFEGNTTGKMRLETIVEDAYFSPWQDDFAVEEHTSVKVKVNEQKQSTKPSVTVRIPVKNSGPVIRKGKITMSLREAVEICLIHGLKKKKDILNLLRSYSI